MVCSSIVRLEGLVVVRQRGKGECHDRLLGVEAAEFRMLTRLIRAKYESGPIGGSTTVTSGWCSRPHTDGAGFPGRAVSRPARELMTLLRGLEPGDWDRPTACALWSVKDIVAHLLDTSLRRLSFGSDGLHRHAGSSDLELCRPGRLSQSAQRRVDRRQPGGSAPGSSSSCSTSPAGRFMLSFGRSIPMHRRTSGLPGPERSLAELVRHRAGVHRTLAAPAADPRGGRRTGAHRAALAPSHPRHLRPGPALHLPRGQDAAGAERPVRDPG